MPVFSKSLASFPPQELHFCQVLNALSRRPRTFSGLRTYDKWTGINVPALLNTFAGDGFQRDLEPAICSERVYGGMTDGAGGAERTTGTPMKRNQHHNKEAQHSQSGNPPPTCHQPDRNTFTGHFRFGGNRKRKHNQEYFHPRT